MRSNGRQVQNSVHRKTEELHWKTPLHSFRLIHHGTQTFDDILQTSKQSTLKIIDWILASEMKWNYSQEVSGRNEWMEWWNRIFHIDLNVFDRDFHTQPLLGFLSLCCIISLKMEKVMFFLGGAVNWIFVTICKIFWHLVVKFSWNRFRFVYFQMFYPLQSSFSELPQSQMVISIF